ncbi:MAG: prepilin-type N-terminal cleavage/methylation domain-containing protein [Opitutaceae bacterium]|jgi:prepilin-type N-terminal cleavage/methylation domain-containing protein/prepilin-type processing-associated H-X9-DG protein
MSLFFYPRDCRRKIRESSGAAFTLTELLVVIAIIGILAAILIPTVGKVRNNARASQCLSSIRRLGTGLLMYTQGTRGQLPGPTNPKWDYAALGQLNPADSVPYSGILKCPADEVERIGTNAAWVRSYTYNPALFNLDNQYVSVVDWGSNCPSANTGIRLAALSSPARSVLLLERHEATNVYNSGNWVAGASIYDAHQGSMNLVYCDGHAGKVPVSLDAWVFRRTYLSRGQ